MHLASKFGVLATPTLVVYHVPSGRVINSNVKPDLLHEARAAQTWDDWQKGIAADLSFGGASRIPSSLTSSELLRKSRWTIAFALFALIYSVNGPRSSTRPRLTVQSA